MAEDYFSQEASFLLCVLGFQQPPRPRSYLSPSEDCSGHWPNVVLFRWGGYKAVTGTCLGVGTCVTGWWYAGVHDGGVSASRDQSPLYSAFEP